MEHNLKLILEEFEQLKGQHVIISESNIVRLVAIGDDEFDWYYICWDGRKITWYSCLCFIIPLKGYIRDKDYERIIRLAKLNDWDSPDLFGRGLTPEIEKINKEAKKEAETLSKNHKTLTPFCWDIN